MCRPRKARLCAGGRALERFREGLDQSGQTEKRLEWMALYVVALAMLEEYGCGVYRGTPVPLT